MTYKKRAALINENFNNLTKDNLDILNDFYDEKVNFVDPVRSVKGLKQLKKYYSHAYANVISISFNFHEINHQDDLYFAKWTMNLQAKGLNLNKPFPVEGLSVIQFTDANKVIYHRDYLDLGSMVYENIPVLGSLIKLIKKKLG